MMYSSAKHPPGDDHPFLSHPFLGRRPHIPDKSPVEAAFAAAEGGAEFVDAVAASQGGFFEADGAGAHDEHPGLAPADDFQGRALCGPAAGGGPAAGDGGSGGDFLRGVI